MRRTSPHGFTLIETITVVAVIVVLAGLVISVAGYANNKAARDRATGEIKAFEIGCGAYQIDNGAPPQNDDTDELDPRVDVSPTSSKYQKANQHLYSCLTGDFLPQSAPDGVPEPENTKYQSFNPHQLSFVKDTAGSIKTVKYLQDPFGYCYGYSTAAAKLETEFRKELKRNPAAPRSTDLKGYNSTFDLWSTSSGTTITQKAKWVKNWAE